MRDIKSIIKVLLRYHVSQRADASTEIEDIIYAKEWLRGWTNEFNWNEGYTLSAEQLKILELNKNA